MDTDRNLLFGVLALQMELVDARQFADACAGWAARKDTPLADLLIERRWITPEDRREVERVLERKLQRYGGNVHQTLLQASNAELRAAAQTISDPEVQQVVGKLALGDSDTVVTPSAQKDFRTRYELTRLHAEGGLGKIYVARDTDLNREVALKEIKPQHAHHPEASRRFLKEAQVTGQLEHPNIVPVYELARRPEDNTAFYTMRFVRGQTLRDAISAYHAQRRGTSDQKLELTRLLGAFVSVCQAVAFAHSRSVIHRDLKPDNVVLGDFGEVVLLDWGLARILGDPTEDSEPTRVAVTDEANTELTKVGRVMGTPAYMAPEQAEGRHDLASPATDIYGLGAILFAILTSHPPNQGTDWLEMVQHVTTKPTPHARAFDPSVPAALDMICARAMARLPAERYAQAADLAHDIQRYLADEPVSVYQEPWTVRLIRWARRHRTWTLLGSVVLVAIILTTTLASVLLARLADQERDARIAADQMREQSSRVAATFAARTVAGEIDLRWRVLEMEAADPELHRLLLGLRDAVPLMEQAEWKNLQAWLQARYEEHFPATRATSWILFAADGTLVARSPVAETIGRNFAFRDYFHGQGRDLVPENAQGVKPIRDVHRSIVFESQATHHRMLVFSVPVWNGNPDLPDRRVIGVLGMTVELGRFSILQHGLSKDQVAVLVDTREDRIEDQPRKGLILHHPWLAELRSEQAGKLPVLRLEESRIAVLENLRAQKLRQDREVELLDWNKQLTLQRESLPGSLDQEYQDPVEREYAGRWLAAFEPVLVKGRADRTKDTGWVVIVQERREAGARSAPVTPR